MFYTVMKFLHGCVLLILQLCASVDLRPSTQIDIIILGGTGNLASKHLWLGLSRLKHNGINLYAAGRSTEDFGRIKLASILKNLDLNDLLNVTYIQLQTDDNYKKLCSTLEQVQDSRTIYGRIFYVAIPPLDQIFVYNNISSYCKTDKGWTKIAIDKPFTEELLQKVLSKGDVYLVDHYLWKRSVRYLRDFRILNHQQLSSIWTPSNIAKIEISCLETENSENRVAFYDSSYGVVGDVMESHLTQLFLHLFIDPLNNESSIINSKSHYANSILTVKLQHSYLAQYKSYTGKSRTPTYAFVQLFSSNPFLNSTLIYLESGKALLVKSSNIKITFKNNSTLNVSIYPDIAIFVDKRLCDKQLNCGLNWTLTEKGCVAEDIVDDSYTQIFKSIIQGSGVNFVTPQVALLATKPWRKLKEFLVSTSVSLDKYPDYTEIKLLHDEHMGWIKENNGGRVEL